MQGCVIAIVIDPLKILVVVCSTTIMHYHWPNRRLFPSFPDSQLHIGREEFDHYLPSPYW